MNYGDCGDCWDTGIKLDYNHLVDEMPLSDVTLREAPRADHYWRVSPKATEGHVPPRVTRIDLFPDLKCELP